MEENNNIVEEKKKNNSVLVLIIAIIISLGIGLILGKILFNNTDNKTNNNENSNESNNTNNQNNTNTNTDNTTLKKLSGKIDLNSYCPNSGSCKKEIGIVTINNQELTLSIELNNINTESINGYILLGSKKINISDLSYYTLEKSYDGFEIYKDYLILYTSNLESMNYCTEGIKGYMMYIFDSNLNEVSGLAGYTLNNPFDDIKIEDDEVYYYALLATGDAIIYEKISFNDLINK